MSDKKSFVELILRWMLQTGKRIRLVKVSDMWIQCLSILIFFVLKLPWVRGADDFPSLISANASIGNRFIFLLLNFNANS